MRSLSPLDMETVFASLAKTGRLLMVEEDNFTCGWGAEVVARVAETVPSSQAPDGAASPAAAWPRLCAAVLEPAYAPDAEKYICCRFAVQQEERRPTDFADNLGIAEE